MSLNDEELRTFTSLLITVGKCIAERRVLITVAQDAGIRDLEAQLQRHRKSPEYQLTATKFQIAAKQAEVDQPLQIWPS